MRQFLRLSDTACSLVRDRQASVDISCHDSARPQPLRSPNLFWHFKILHLLLTLYSIQINLRIVEKSKLLCNCSTSSGKWRPTGLDGDTAQKIVNAVRIYKPTVYCLLCMPLYVACYFYKIYIEQFNGTTVRVRTKLTITTASPPPRVTTSSVSFPLHATISVP
jgi:hypothetical protein